MATVLEQPTLPQPIDIDPLHEVVGDADGWKAIPSLAVDWHVPLERLIELFKSER